MDWKWLLVLFAAIAFVIGTALTFWRSPNKNPLARLAAEGKLVDATVLAIEGDTSSANVELRYEVAGNSFTRSIPWPANRTLPEIGSSVQLKYLPLTPGLSRLA